MAVLHGSHALQDDYEKGMLWPLSVSSSRSISYLSEVSLGPGVE